MMIAARLYRHFSSSCRTRPQDAVHGGEARGPPGHLAPTDLSVQKQHAVVAAVRHYLPGRAELIELDEEERNGLSYRLVGGHHDASITVVVESDREVGAQLATSSRLPGRPGPRPGSGSSRSEPPRREGAPSRPPPPDARGGGGARSAAR